MVRQSEVEFERLVSNLIHSMGYKISRNVRIKGKSGAIHEPDIKFEDKGKVFLVECKSRLITRKDLFSVYGMFTDLDFDLGFFVAKSLAKQEMDSLKRFGLVALVLEDNPISRSNFKKELRNAIERLHKIEEEKRSRVREINSFYIETIYEIHDLYDLENTLRDLSLKSKYKFEIGSPINSEIYLSIRGLPRTEFAVTPVLKRFIRWSTEKITHEKISMLKKVISVSENLRPVHPTNKSLLSFIEFIEGLGGFLRSFDARSKKRFLTRISVSSVDAKIPTSHLLNVITSNETELSKLYFRFPLRGSIKLYVDPTLRMRYYGQPRQILENWRTRCEQAILQG